MGIANACYRLETRRRKSVTKELDPLSSDLRAMEDNTIEEEQTPLVRSGDHEDEKDESSSNDTCSQFSPEDYEITEKFEMGAMANMFFAPVGVILYYIAICLFITGSQATMLVVIVKTLVILVCCNMIVPEHNNGHIHATVTMLVPSRAHRLLKEKRACIRSMDSSNTIKVAMNTTNGTLPANYIPGRFLPHSICFGDITQQEAYYFILAIAAILTCPWIFFRFTTSKYLQLTTNTMRYIAYGFMVGICIAMLVMGQRASPPPPLAGFTELPALLSFGIITYSFESQHSLPGLITAMRQKQRALLMLFTALIIILVLQSLMSFTAVFWLTFNELQDLYTLNFFIPFSMSYPIDKKVLSIIGYYIMVYPVFAIGPIIPIEGISMRENLKALTRMIFKEEWTEVKPYMLTVDHILLPLVVVTIPLALAFVTGNVDLLLSITGGVFGVWIQYLMSTALLFAGKRFLMKKYTDGKYENKYKSPFSHIFFLVFIIIWTVVSVVLVITGHVLTLCEI